jgi:hypothetical protein
MSGCLGMGDKGYRDYKGTQKTFGEDEYVHQAGGNYFINVCNTYVRNYPIVYF